MENVLALSLEQFEAHCVFHLTLIIDLGLIVEHNLLFSFHSQ